MNPDSAAQMSFDVPVLLITWRRPDTTRQVIDAMRAAAPSRVFVASDGPRTPEEAIKVQATRELVASAIDWPCEIQTCYSSSNQGCRQGVSSGISWFFEHVEEGIILEDDCVPHPWFFQFCATMLSRYRTDKRIWTVTGTNYQDGRLRGGISSAYYLSRYMACWGWATWRNRWKHYSKNYAIWDEVSNSKVLQKSMFHDSLESSYWLQIWTKLYRDNIPDSWAYRWQLVCIANNGLTVVPDVNLIQNVGTGDDSTHTQGASMPAITNQHSLRINKTKVCFLPDVVADRYAFDNYFGGSDARKNAKLTYRLTRSLKIALRAPLYYPRKVLKLFISG